MKIIATTGVAPVEPFLTLVGPNGITVAIFQPSGWPDFSRRLRAPMLLSSSLGADDDSSALDRVSGARAGAVALRVMRGASVRLVRATAVSLALIDFALALVVWFRYDPAAVPWQFTERFAGVSSFGAAYALGVTASITRSVALTALGGLLAAAAMAKLPERSARSYPSLLLLQGAILGAYMALDLPVVRSVLGADGRRRFTRSFDRAAINGSVGSPRRLALLVAAGSVTLMLGAVVTRLNRGPVTSREQLRYAAGAGAASVRDRENGTPDFLSFAACGDERKPASKPAGRK